MQWVGTQERLPQKSQAYIISVSKSYGGGQLIFNYVAYFDVNTGDWYKYDEFEDKPEPKEKIHNNVLGWLEDLGAFMG